MERTKLTAFYGFMQSPFYAFTWLIAFLILPFASYVGLGLIILMILVGLVEQSDEILANLWHQGYGVLTLGLVVTTGTAVEPGQALLQLANFLPYFLLFGVLSTAPTWLYRPVEKLHGLAQALVLTSMPISAMAIVEYLAKLPMMTAQVSSWAIFAWVFEANYDQHRVQANLSYPNILSAYLVIMLGLGLGLIWHQLQGHAQGQGETVKQDRWVGGKGVLPALVTANVLSLAANFCTGSRNGILISIFQLVLFGCLIRHRRRLMLVGLGFAIATVLSTLLWGVGGRQVTLDLITQDPRVGVWHIALELIRERPILGWGLGGFGAHYVPNSVAGYDFIHHAHNLWLYLASEVGIPLMLLFSLMIGKLYYQGIRAFLKPLPTDASTPALSPLHRATLLSYLMAFGGCIMFGFFDVPLFDSRINVLGWLMVAGISILTNTSRKPVTTVALDELG